MLAPAWQNRRGASAAGSGRRDEFVPHGRHPLSDGEFGRGRQRRELRVEKSRHQSATKVELGEGRPGVDLFEPRRERCLAAGIRRQLQGACRCRERNPGGDVDQRGTGGGAGIAAIPSASTSAARARLCAITAQVNWSALTSIRLDGKCFMAERFRSAMTCSSIAWSLWWASAIIIGSVELVKTASCRSTPNSSS